MNTHALDLEASSSQYASISDASQTGLDLSASLSIEALIKFESLPTSGNVYGIVSKWNSSSATYRAYKLVLYNNAGTYQLMAEVGNGTSDDTKTQNWTPTIGDYYNLVWTWDGGTKSFKFYINGLQLGTTQTGTNVSSIVNNDRPFWIGAGRQDIGDYFDGLIDDVRVWNDVRTQQEIQDNMFKELVGNEANLVGYWKLNNNYLDETSNNNDLTASGSPVFTNDIAFSDSDNQIEHCVDDDTVALWHLSNLNDSSPNSLTLTNNNSATLTTGWDGTANGAYDLESSSSQYLSVADNSVLDLANGYTISCKVKFESVLTSDGYMPFVAKYNQATNKQSYAFYFRRDGGVNYLQARQSSDGTNGTTVDVSYEWTPNTGVWYDVAVVYDKTNTDLYLYLNGVRVATQSSATSSLYNSDLSLRIGSIENLGASTWYFDGVIDEVEISNRVKSSNEIMKYYGCIVSGKFYPDANIETTSVDGNMYYTGANWATTRSSSTATASQDSDATNDNYFQLRTNLIGKIFLLFDTSTLLDNCNIIYSSISQKLAYITGTDSNSNQNISLVSSTPASNTTLSTDDFDQLGSTRLASDILITSSDTSYNYRTFILNDTGLNNISTNSISKFGIRFANDLDNTDPSSNKIRIGGYFSETSDVISDPYIWIEYYEDAALAYTLVCDTGSFVLTGIAATLRRSYVLVCAVGSFSLTGIETIFKRGYGLICSVGSFILTGINASFRFSGWSRRTKPTSSWDNRTKPDSTWTNRNKPTTNWTNE